MAGESLSKSQLDKLGDRLRGGAREETDLRALDDYRHTFRPAFDAVMESLKNLRLEKTGRMKTVGAIVEKLNRQRIRLTQIQDIAGIRLTCADTYDQELLTKYLAYSFPESEIDDRRQRPSHGYRAVHVIVTSSFDRMVEIQLRTQAQHRWAQVSEKLADRLGIAVKYGGGPKWALEALTSYSETVQRTEELDRQHREMLHDAYDLRPQTPDAPTAAEREKLIAWAEELETRVREQRPAIDRELERIATLIEKRTGNEEDNDDLPD